MINIMLSVLSALMVVGAFAAGLLIGTGRYAKPAEKNSTSSAPDLSQEELELIEAKRKRKQADDEAFAHMMGYNQSMVYNMSSRDYNEGS